MSVFSVRRAVAVVGAVVLSGAVFAVPASAADLPPVGSDACLAAVAAAPGVKSAEVALRKAESAATFAASDVAAATSAQVSAAAALNALPAGDPDFEAATKAVAPAGQKLEAAKRDRATADEALGEAQAAVTFATGVATASLCTDNETDGTPTTTPAPSDQPDPDVVAARIAAQIDTLSCDDYRDELAAIRGALLDTDTQTLLGTQRVGELLERLRLRTAAIGGCTPAPAPVVGDDRDCADFVTPADAQRFFLAVRTVANPDPARLDSNSNGIACESSEVVVSLDPLADDDSVANATQIRIVPQGSVSTGGA